MAAKQDSQHRSRKAVGKGSGKGPRNVKQRYVQIPSKCSIASCGKVLSHPAHLSHHMKLHKGDLQYVCWIKEHRSDGSEYFCAKACRNKGNWRCHARSHGIEDIGEPLYYSSNKNERVSQDEINFLINEMGCPSGPPKGRRPNQKNKRKPKSKVFLDDDEDFDDHDDSDGNDIGLYNRAQESQTSASHSPTVSSQRTGSPNNSSHHTETYDSHSPKRKISRLLSQRVDLSTQPVRLDEKRESTQSAVPSEYYEHYGTYGTTYTTGNVMEPSVLKRRATLQNRQLSTRQTKVYSGRKSLTHSDSTSYESQTHPSAGRGVLWDSHGNLSKRPRKKWSSKSYQQMMGDVASIQEKATSTLKKHRLNLLSRNPLRKLSAVVEVDEEGQGVEQHKDIVVEGDQNASAVQKHLERGGDDKVQERQELFNKVTMAETHEQPQMVNEVKQEYDDTQDSVKSEVKQDTQILEGDQSNMHYEEEEEDEESSDDSRETHEPTDSSGDEMPTVTEHENEMHDVLQVLKSVTCPPEPFTAAMSLMLDTYEKISSKKYSGEHISEEDYARFHEKQLSSYVAAIDCVAKDVKLVSNRLFDRANNVERKLRIALADAESFALSEKKLADDAIKACADANFARNEAEADCAILRHDLQVATESLEKMTKEAEVLKRHLSGKVSAIEVESIDNLKKEISDSKVAIKEKDQTIENLQKLVQETKVENEKLKAEFEKISKKKDMEIDELRQKSGKMEHENKKKDTVLSQHDKLLQQCNDQFVKIQNENKQNKAALTGSEKELQKSRDKYAQLTKEIQVKDQTLLSVQKDLEQLRNLQENNTKNADNMAVMDEELHSLKEQLQEQKAEADKLKDEHDRIQNLYDQSVQDKDELHRAVKSEKEKLKTVAEENETLILQLNDVKRKLTELHGDTKKKRATVDRELIRLEKEFARLAANPPKRRSKTDFLIKPDDGPWNYQEIKLDHKDGVPLSKDKEVTEGGLRMILYEILQNSKDVKGLIPSRWYTWDVDLFRFIDNCDFMRSVESFILFVKEVYRIDIDDLTGKANGEGRLVIDEGQEHEVAQTSEPPGPQEIYGRSLIHAEKPVHWDEHCRWGLKEMRDDFLLRFPKNVSWALTNDITNDANWGRKNNWLDKNGVLFSVNFSEHWMLLIFANGPKLLEQEKIALRFLFKGKRAITINVDGPEFEEVEVNLDKACFILVDSQLDYELTEKGRVIACYREFLCQYYELKLKSEAPWKNAPCYIGDYMQQLGGLSCGIHVARVVETLVLGVPFNNLEFNIDVYRKKWFHVFLKHQNLEKHKKKLDDKKKKEDEKTAEQEQKTGKEHHQNGGQQLEKRNQLNKNADEQKEKVTVETKKAQVHIDKGGAEKKKKKRR